MLLVFNVKASIFILGTPELPPGLANLKQNSDENPGVGSIPLKSILIFKQAQRAVELSLRQILKADQNKLVLIALSEAIVSDQ